MINAPLQPSHAAVRLYRCPHGTYHLTLNTTTMHLSERELVMAGQAISHWAQEHPQWIQHMFLDKASSASSHETAPS